MNHSRKHDISFASLDGAVVRREKYKHCLDSRGYTMIELLLVIAVIGILSAYAVSRSYGNANSTGGGERAIQEVERRLSERRDAAIRLNQLLTPTSLENFTAPPVVIDFNDPSSTRPLLTEGVDANGDGVDDNTGAPITRITPPSSPGGQATWNYGYDNAPALTLPAGWSLVTSQSQLGSIPLIGAGTQGRGLLATSFGFDSRGRPVVQLSSAPDPCNAEPIPPGCVTASGEDDAPPPVPQSQWTNIPSGSDPAASSPANAPFWAVYLVQTPPLTAIQTRFGLQPQPVAAVAIAVHPTGQLERWRWDGTTWQGFRRRTLP